MSEVRCKATCKTEFKLPWREAGPPNHHDDKVEGRTLWGLGSSFMSASAAFDPPMNANTSTCPAHGICQVMRHI